MATSISPGFKKLLSEPAYCEVATLMPDGSPQITQVWVDTDGEHVLINTSEDRQKTRNVQRDPRVAVNVVDPKNPWRLASVRGKVVAVTTDGADDLIDRLAQKYLGQEKYPNRRPGEVRVTLKIAPEKVREIGLDQAQGS
jgi:PPOX class probable F420-dependent enzyme